MNQFLKSAADRYDKLKKSDYLISPLSEVDGEIMVEIVELFKKVKANDVVAVLKQYKELKDTEIRDMLLQLNIDKGKLTENKRQSNDELGSEIMPEEEEYPSMIQFNDYHSTCIKRTLILGYSKYTLIDKESNVPYPSILINHCDETATKKPMYANFVLVYDEEEEREEDLIMLMEEVNS